MTLYSLHSFFDRLGMAANRLPGARRRVLRRTGAELARYPSIVRADLGWPRTIDDGLPAKCIIKYDEMNSFNSFA